ncbi:MAG: PP2C family protein-serine/threonine phosphatase [Bacteroidota bacterium]
MIKIFQQDINSDLEPSDFKLNSLLEITNAINQNLEVEQLIKIYEFILKEQMGFDRFVLFFKEDEWSVLLKVGVKLKVLQLDVESELKRFKDITFIESSYSSLLNEFDVVIPVYQKEKALAYLLVKDTHSDHPSRDNRMNFVQTLTNIIGVAIENKRMTKLGLIQERIKKELEVASELQKLLFPSDLPSNRRMDISARYTPRHEVGGDYYDFIPLGDDEYIICIADVSGKGIGAAMLMANFQATIRTMFKYQRFELEFLLEELNKKVMRNAKGEKFITFFIAHYNAHTRELKYANAGHNHPILSNGRKFELLHKGSIGLGMLDELPFIEIGTEVLKANTTLLLYTDGVVELENKDGDFYGIERLVKNLHTFYGLKMDDLNSLIFSKLNEWKGELELVDDTAIFACKFF